LCFAGVLVHVEENAAAHEVPYDKLYTKLRPPTEEGEFHFFLVITTIRG